MINLINWVFYLVAQTTIYALSALGLAAIVFALYLGKIKYFPSDETLAFREVLQRHVAEECAYNPENVETCGEIFEH